MGIPLFKTPCFTLAAFRILCIILTCTILIMMFWFGSFGVHFVWVPLCFPYLSTVSVSFFRPGKFSSIVFSNTFSIPVLSSPSETLTRWTLVYPIYLRYLFENQFIISTTLGLCCSAGFSPAVASGGYSLVSVHGLLIVVASLVVEHRLQDMWASVVAAHGLIIAACRL